MAKTADETLIDLIGQLGFQMAVAQSQRDQAFEQLSNMQAELDRVNALLPPSEPAPKVVPFKPKAKATPPDTV